MSVSSCGWERRILLLRGGLRDVFAGFSFGHIAMISWLCDITVVLKNLMIIMAYLYAIINGRSHRGVEDENASSVKCLY